MEERALYITTGYGIDSQVPTEIGQTWMTERNRFHLPDFRMYLWCWELETQGWYGLTSGEWDDICKHRQASPRDGVNSERHVRRFHLYLLKSLLIIAPPPSDHILWGHYVCGLLLQKRDFVYMPVLVVYSTNIV